MSREPDKPWFQTDGVIAWALLLFYPVGVVLMWRYAPWRRRFKWLWTFAVPIALPILFVLTFFQPAQPADDVAAPVPQSTPTAASLVATVTVGVPSTAVAVVATPSPSPDPLATPVGVRFDARERVWVYADAVETGYSCFEHLPDMIPASASSGIEGKAAECTISSADIFRAFYARDFEGVLHLQAVELFVLLSQDYPEGVGYPACRDVGQLLLPASVPAEEAAFVGVCSWVPPVRGEATREVIETWSGVPVGSSQTEFPPDTPCWRTSGHLGGQTEAQTIKVRCIIE